MRGVCARAHPQPHGALLRYSYIVLRSTLVANRPGLPALAHPGGQARTSLRTVCVMTATTDVRVRRIYDPPEPADGHRVLVDQLWPRGVAKSAVHDWDKAVAPPPSCAGGMATRAASSPSSASVT